MPAPAAVCWASCCDFPACRGDNSGQSMVFPVGITSYSLLPVLFSTPVLYPKLLPSSSGFFMDLQPLLMPCPPPSGQVSPSCRLLPHPEHSLSPLGGILSSFCSSILSPSLFRNSNTLIPAVFLGPHRSQMMLLALSPPCARWRNIYYGYII